MLADKIYLNAIVESFLRHKGMMQVAFVNLTDLPVEMSQNYSFAILFATPLSSNYVQILKRNPDYVQEMIKAKTISKDEFHCTEIQTDACADELATFLINLGYSACSQSERQNQSTNRYDASKRRTPLPNKTIALKAGWGWIGKNNLLVTMNWGSGFCMCSVLTDAPLQTFNRQTMISKCGSCTTCVNVCKTRALKGKMWGVGVDRDLLLDVNLCTTCH